MTAQDNTIETWTEYSIAVAFIFIRIISRTRLVGSNWAPDDYCVIVSLLALTSYFVHIDMIGRYGTTIGLTDQQRHSLTSAEIQPIVLGSKLLVSGWISWACLIWSLKACMLFLYARLTTGGVWQRKLVLGTAALSVVTFISMICVILFHCFPLTHQWQILPDPGTSCSKQDANHIAYAVLNITTDTLLILIPIPILWNLKMEMTRKVGLWVMFASGIFLIIATILRTINALGNASQNVVAILWSNREAMIAVITINLPALRPIVTHRFWQKGSYLDSEGGKTWSSYSSRSRSNGRPSGSKERAGGLSTFASGHSDEHEIHATTTVTVDHDRERRAAANGLGNETEAFADV